MESSAMSIPAAVYGVLMFLIGVILAMYGWSIILKASITSPSARRRVLGVPYL
ncbi:hypothetical protein [Marinobacter metalliresistant]|uniref:Uncharacterized protein n=1 Tax=Marinobacter metalliresistant TaxID=2961995 RepID=A0ABZ2W762_9GAMM